MSTPHHSLVGAGADRAPSGEVSGANAYAKAIRRRLPLIVLVTALAVGLAVGLSLRAEKQYDAVAVVLLQENEPVNRILDPTAQSGSDDPERDVNTQVALIRLQPIARRVIERLSLDTKPEALLRKIETELQGESRLVDITARDPSATRAAAIANAFADVYREFRRRSARASFDEAAQLARTQLEAMTDQERLSPEGRGLEGRLRELEIGAAAQTGGIEVVRRASPPGDPAVPRPKLAGAMALLLGLALGSALALALELLDRRLRDEEAVESFFGLPVLASVPRPRRRFGSVAAPGDDPGQYEGYSALATNLRFFELGPDLRSLLVTSAAPAEGKSTVTLGTARALATLGERVIAIEGDLRRPTFQNYGLGGAGEGGVSTVLSGQSSFKSALIEVSAQTFEPVNGSAAGPTFRVLPAGPLPPHPQALLSRPAMRYLLGEMRAIADVVLIDAPPIGTVNDAVTVAGLVDGVILVARLGESTRDAARRAVRQLANVDARLLGVVITGGTPGDSGYYSERAPTAAVAAESASA